MTISALILAKQFYARKPGITFAYATIGLLFVNISVGGTFSHFSAPPVLMVAEKWNWGFTYMITHFGYKALMGIVLANVLYYFFFRSELKKLAGFNVTEDSPLFIKWDMRDDPVPIGVTVAHIFFMIWTVYFAHYPPLFIAGFLCFLGFAKATGHHQNRTDLKPALLVGFFLAGLVVHGGLQKWWISPILGNLSEIPLMVGSTVLSAFNDNASITFLSSLVPTLTDSMKYAVVAGAVTGGGLTVIANAPNPAGQSILQKFFPDGVSPLGLLTGALVPTIIMWCIFMFAA
jgi:Na+/H+ antiporter NhaD/arsenite permease-like protein